MEQPGTTNFPVPKSRSNYAILHWSETLHYKISKDTSENAIPINQNQRSLKSLKKRLLKIPNSTNAYDFHHIARHSLQTINHITRITHPTGQFDSQQSKTLHTLQKLHFQIPRIPESCSTIDLNARHKIIIHNTSVSLIRRHNSVRIDQKA